MEVSIIIVSFNTKKLTEDTIKSLYREEKDLDFEIIVIDNNSQDGSIEMLEELKKKNKNISLIKNDSNTGFAYANNQGIRISKGKYVFLLNSDTVIKKNAISMLIDFAKTRSDAGVVAPKLLNADGTTQPSVLRFPSIKNAILEYWFGKKGLFDKYYPKGDGPFLVDSVVGAAFLITPEAMKRVGLLDQKYFFYFEDIDYCRKVWEKGLKVYYYPRSVITHYHGASGKTIADTANQWRRLIPSSKAYHGILKHYLLFLIMWTGQKWQKIFGKANG